MQSSTESDSVASTKKTNFGLADVHSKMQQKLAEAEEARRRASEEAAQRRREESKWYRAIKAEEERLEDIRSREAEGYPHWSAKDFGGAYHSSRIANKFPIAGSAIELERVRKSGIVTRKDREARELAEVQLTHEYRARAKGVFAEQREVFKGRYSTRVYLEEDVMTALGRRDVELAHLRKRFRRERDAFSCKDGTPLVGFMAAVRAGELEKVQGMLNRGEVDINEVGSFNQGETALMEACKHGRVTMANMLLDLGADPNQKSARGEGTLHMVWYPVLQDGGKACQGLHRVVALRNVYSLLERLFAEGADPGMLNPSLQSTLHIAAAEQCTAICDLILRAGEPYLLDLKDSQGQTPLDVAPSETHESSKLLRNWRACVKGNKLTDFQKAWFHYMNAPAVGPRLAIRPSAGKVINELRVSDFRRHAGTALRDGIASRRHEEIEADRTKASAGFSESEGSLTNKRPVAEYVQLAQKRYTATFRAKVEQERKMLKPSDRKLTLVEYLVGVEARKRAAELDRKSKTRGSHGRLLTRRKAVAHALLADTYRGGAERVRRRDLEDVPLEATDDEHVAADVLQNNVLRRPWTVSAIGRSGGAFHPRVLGRVVRNVRGTPENASAMARISSHYAQRAASVTHITSAMQADEQADEVEAEVAVSTPQANTATMMPTAKERLTRRMTVRLANVQEDESIVGSRPLHIDQGEEEKSDSREEEIAQGFANGRASRNKSRRKGAIAQNANALKATQESVEAAEKNLRYSGGRDKEDSSSDQGSKARSLRPGANATYRSKHVPAALMPPQYNMREVLSSLTLDANGKSTYTRVEVASVLTLLRARLPGDVLSSQLSNAILRAIHHDERTDAGNVTVEELREQFRDFHLNKKPVDTTPVFDALEKSLNARFREELFHASLGPYHVYSTDDLQRPGPYMARPANTQPWLGSHVRLDRNRVLRDRHHDENPLHASAFGVMRSKGASSGIGRAIAVHLSRQNLGVLAVARREEQLQETRKLGVEDNIEIVVADLTTKEGRESVAEVVRSKCSKQLKYVVQNAGVIGKLDQAINLKEDMWRHVFEVNVHAPFFLAQLLVPELAPDARVLHVSSGAAHGPFNGWTAYNVSKAAFYMMYQCMRDELAPKGIHFGSFQPGIVESNMQETIRDATAEETAIIEMFKEFKANQYTGPEDKPHAPPKGGLDVASNVAFFVDFLLTKVPAEEFSSHGEWDISDESHHSRWITEE
ncbi:Dehydrogenase/reductase SDR family member 4 [Hondaea fermentalgiana]|uniref:Dehydrogenase/reductase SDR family member 4 n=1 Tax=Hondaea fermentalgiana TaxID=2315210 RepID=A0A2R5GKW7_9STRA|nr:Dehydrogenase/reductase SDR family member 4 [Hondaea fermentalgiana]|eukprot:GBG28921.1 Dehydrogenase/reductase SDR family member 4 [Hondaea fermentalgiana]